MITSSMRLFARSVSVWLKIAAAIIGLVAAWFWYVSATSPETVAAAIWNSRAAVATGGSVLLQAASAGIDAWVPPTASWD